MIKKIKKCINADLPVLIIGKTGWGKSQMVYQVANDLELILIDLRLAQIPAEDIGGLPYQDKDGNYFKYLLPQWAQEIKDNPKKSYLLFLDEINQASSNTINAIYSIVLDKKIAGVKLDNMVIVAAGNYDTESDYLTQLPSPLLNRFIKLELDHNEHLAKEYLNNKYKNLVDNKLLDLVLADPIYSSPRTLENGIRMLRKNIDDINLLNTCFKEETSQKIIEYLNDDNIIRLEPQYYIDSIRGIKTLIERGSCFNRKKCASCIKEYLMIEFGELISKEILGELDFEYLVSKFIERFSQ
jgi:hypothetical protein